MQTASQDVIRYLERGFECWSCRAIQEMMEQRRHAGRGGASPTVPLPEGKNVLRGRAQISAYYDRMWDTWSGFGWKPLPRSSVSATTATRCLVRILTAEEAGAARPRGRRPRSSTRSPTA